MEILWIYGIVALLVFVRISARKQMDILFALLVACYWPIFFAYFLLVKIIDWFIGD